MTQDAGRIAEYLALPKATVNRVLTRAGMARLSTSSYPSRCSVTSTDDQAT